MKSRLPISALTVTLGTAALLGFAATQATAGTGCAPQGPCPKAPGNTQGAVGSTPQTPASSAPLGGVVDPAAIGYAPVTKIASGVQSLPQDPQLRGTTLQLPGGRQIDGAARTLTGNSRPGTTLQAPAPAPAAPSRQRVTGKPGKPGQSPQFLGGELLAKVVGNPAVRQVRETLIRGKGTPFG